MKNQSIFATPKDVTDIKSCYFYHTIDLPGHGVIEGNWDLRDHYHEYLGGVDFKDKSVLEIGTANGAICFWMESNGASVISFDLSPEEKWDIIPHPSRNVEQVVEERKYSTKKLNNAYWFCHRALNSKTKVVYGNIYNIPEAIGPVDYVTYGSILLHVRDPFLALQTGLRFAREKVIITELGGPSSPEDENPEPSIQFFPNPEIELYHNIWWRFSPRALINMLGILGFGNAEVFFHTQLYEGKEQQVFTIVAERTSGFDSLVK